MKETMAKHNVRRSSVCVAIIIQLGLPAAGRNI